MISDLPVGETITVYRQGDWKDLCRGPHLPSTKHVGKAFKLTKLAGAYWRGDHRKPDSCSASTARPGRPKEDLDAYLQAPRGGRKARPPQDRQGHGALPHAGRGQGAWSSGTPRAGPSTARCEAYMRRRLDADGYVEVKAPQIMDRALWEKSGHWEKFGQNMFTCETTEGEELAVKPMNCPGHVQIFNFGQKSYRDLPLRMAEFGACHRYRAVRRPARHHAPARLHPGRRPHLLPRGPDRGGDDEIRPPAELGLCRLRPGARQREAGPAPGPAGGGRTRPGISPRTSWTAPPATR